MLTVPTLSLCGSLDPLSTFAAFLSKTAAGGVLVIKLKDRSPKTVITTGIIIPFWSWVLALKALQNSIMFTPCWPSAGPTGGDGFADPAGIWSFIFASIFLAMGFHLFPYCAVDLFLPIASVHLDLRNFQFVQWIFQAP
jgi:hypothetical protein